MVDRLTVLGSADAFNAAGRRHSCYLLEGEGFDPVMIDCGATALLALRSLGLSPAAVRGLAITHLHGDHVGGFPFLVIDGMFHERREGTLAILGPVGLEQRLARVVDVAYGDIMDRPKGFEIAYEERLPGSSTSWLNLRVETFAASHMDLPEQPLCLRFTLPSGKVVAFSGDTEMGEGLLAAARGADLLVAECSGLRPPIGRHCTWEDWQARFPELGATRIVLSHLGTAVRASIDDLLAAAPATTSLTFADDGLVVTL
ncbi:MAG: MBL fold metallo-hydrolase [Myxococcales bacterium]|nr:MBL fold metallo-hydrolase [Myxococcales bacterium]